MKSSLIWHYVLYVVSVKSMVKISSIFVAFLENTNFMNKKDTIFVIWKAPWDNNQNLNEYEFQHFVI